MTDRKRFTDTLPPLDPITESHWDRLNGEERADLLRRRHAQVVEALTWNVDATRLVSKQVDEAVMPMLEANTAATARTEAKVETSDKKLDLLVERTERPLAAWQNLEGTGNVISAIGSFLKGAAWITVPGAMLFGAGKAFMAWADAGFPGMLK
jgi:hypothetical protein